MQSRSVLPTLILLIAAAVVAFAVWLATRPADHLIQGEVTAPSVDVSARTSGRVVALGPDVGQVAQKGAMLVTLENPQLVAGYAAAESGLAVARASEAAAGATRPEVIRAREAELAVARADLQLARDQAERDGALLDRGVRSQAMIDQTNRNLEAASSRVEAAEAQLDLARTGASPEERAVAGAQVKQAESALAQRQADLDELSVFAPIGAEVATRMVEPGENVAPGTPLYTLVDLDGAYFTFNLREDLLAQIKMGDEIAVRVPALETEVPARVTLINVQGQFATWRATRATGDFDLRSFEVRLKPATEVPGLRPGMSGLIDLSAR